MAVLTCAYLNGPGSGQQPSGGSSGGGGGSGSDGSGSGNTGHAAAAAVAAQEGCDESGGGAGPSPREVALMLGRFACNNHTICDEVSMGAPARRMLASLDACQSRWHPLTAPPSEHWPSHAACSSSSPAQQLRPEGMGAYYQLAPISPQFALSPQHPSCSACTHCAHPCCVGAAACGHGHLPAGLSHQPRLQPQLHAVL